MRAREFTESKQQVDEFAPFLAALGGALARGATAAGTALARGAVAAGSKIAQGATQLGTKAVQGAGQVAKTAATSAASAAGTTIGTVAANKLTGQSSQQTQQPPQAPAVLPPNTKIEPVISNDPNKMGFKIGDANFSLDTKDPKNAQVLQQLSKLAPKQ
jgi:hypothetical protein